jgi:lipopolysaccharide biosynthesis glycosyltransferase
VTETVRIFIGFDPREAVAYHVCCQSIIETSTVPVSFHPLHRTLLKGFDGQRDGTNAFTFSRYLIPYLCDFNGWALFLDGDMTVNADIARLWEFQKVHYNKAVAVVKHDYLTKNPRKYIGSALENANVDYPRKNWSSVVLWNCAHYSNRTLMPEYVRDAPPSFLHRFQWLSDKDIGDLPVDWNHLVGEYPPASPSLHHFTLGLPGIKHYSNDSGSWKWHAALLRALQCAGEVPSEMVWRAQERVGGV